MGLVRKLWNYCPRPVKEKRRFLSRIAVPLGILRLEKLRRPSESSLLSMASFGISSLLVFSGMLLVVNFTTQGSLDLRAFFSNLVLDLFLVPGFIGIWAITDILLKKVRREGTKVLLAILCLLVIIPIFFSAGLGYGMFDSLTLLDDSAMDLSTYSVTLHIRNNGLTEVKVTAVEIGNLTYNLSGFAWENVIKPGRSNTLNIYCAWGAFSWGNSQYAEPEFSQHEAGPLASPGSFEEGKISAKIHTDGIMSYVFEIDAKFSAPEEIQDFQARVFNLYEENTSSLNCYLPDIAFTFDMPEDSVALVYSIEIGDLTLQLAPPPAVTGTEYGNYLSIWRGSDYQEGATGYAWPGWAGSTECVPDLPLDVPIFIIGELYNVTVRTMTDRYYVSQIRMVD